MQKITSFLSGTVILSQLTHIFCCGLPFLVSFLSFFSILGISTTLPAMFLELHDMLHIWELPILIFSGAMVAFGWGLHVLSMRLDCRSTGCGHEPCGPKKGRSALVLQLASVLFLINCVAYFMFHGEIHIH